MYLKIIFQNDLCSVTNFQYGLDGCSGGMDPSSIITQVLSLYFIFTFIS